MARVRARAPALVLAAAAAAAASGCYVPSSTSAPDRALAIYRETKAHRASLARGHAGSGAAGEIQTLSSDQAAELARQNSGAVAETNARADTFAARVEEAGQWKNPELRASAVQLDEILQDKPKLDLKIRLSPARPGEIDAKVAKARAEESAARASARAAELAAEADARWMFESVLLFDAEIEAADGEARARAKIVEAVKARVDRAQATRVDEALATLGNEEASHASASLRAARGVALGELLDIVGLPGSTNIKLVGSALDPANLPDLPSEDALIEAALAARPELAAAAARVDASDATGYLERAKRWPWLSFVDLGYDFEPGVRRGLGFAFGAGLDVPLFSVNSGGVQRADAEKREAQRAFDAAVDKIARDVRSRLREAKAARELSQAFKDSALPAADRAADAVNAALDAAQTDLVRVALVEERKSAVQRERLKLVRRYHQAMAALRAAVGGRMPNAGPRPEGPPKAPPQ